MEADSESDSEINSDINLEDEENEYDDTSSEPNKRGCHNPNDKRAYHNLLERRRRRDIKDSFCALRDSIPELRGEVGKSKASRAQILKCATSYIVTLNENRAETKKEIAALQEETLQLEKKIKALEKSSSSTSLATPSTSGLKGKRKINNTLYSRSRKSVALSSDAGTSGIRSSHLNYARTGNGSFHVNSKETVDSTPDINGRDSFKSLTNSTCQTDSSIKNNLCLNIKTEDSDDEYEFIDALSNQVMLGLVSPFERGRIMCAYENNSDSLDELESTELSPYSVDSELSNKNDDSANVSSDCDTITNSLNEVDLDKLNQSFDDYINKRRKIDSNTTLSSLNGLDSVDFSQNAMFIGGVNNNTSFSNLNQLNSSVLDDSVSNLFELIPIKEESINLTEFDFSCFEDENMLSPNSENF